MNQYNIIIEYLLSYLAACKQCSSSRKSHKQCYIEFGRFLEESSFSLSENYIDLWVSYIHNGYNRQKSYFWGQYVTTLGTGSCQYFPDEWGNQLSNGTVSLKESDAD